MSDDRPTADPDAVPVVLINVFKCQPEKQDQLIELLGALMRAQTALPASSRRRSIAD